MQLGTLMRRLRNSLKTEPSRLLEQHKATSRNDKVKHAPEQKGAPSHVFYHERRAKRKNEVHQPLTGYADSDARFADTCWEDFRDVGPRKGTPGKVVGDDEHVDESDGGDARGGDVAVGVGGMCFDDCCGADLAGCHEEGATHEDFFAVHSLGDEEDEGEAGCYFDGAEDGGQEEVGVALVADEEFEVLGGVVCAGLCK